MSAEARVTGHVALVVGGGSSGSAAEEPASQPPDWLTDRLTDSRLREMRSHHVSECGQRVKLCGIDAECWDRQAAEIKPLSHSEWIGMKSGRQSGKCRKLVER